MPPKRNGSAYVSGHRTGKRARMKVLPSDPVTTDSDAVTTSALSTSTFTRSFSVSRLSSGRKGQRRSQASTYHPERAQEEAASHSTPPFDATANNEPTADVDIAELDSTTAPSRSRSRTSGGTQVSRHCLSCCRILKGLSENCGLAVPSRFIPQRTSPSRWPWARRRDKQLRGLQ